MHALDSLTSISKHQTIVLDEVGTSAIVFNLGEKSHQVRNAIYRFFSSVRVSNQTIFSGLLNCLFKNIQEVTQNMSGEVDQGMMY